MADVQVGLFKNQKLVAWAEPCETPDSYQGFEEFMFYQLPELELLDTARFLTLTSGAEEGGDPVAWHLEGSTDGENWEVLDERSAQTFRWRRQTRPFLIRSPRACTRHRLVITTATGPLRLAQIELLA